ncbi:helix-turn-helix domain-containing protein [Nocardia sp. NPDC050406]|uniref:helix-turn-helix domain-containing protein n=1 Tax=Nocardia sp. NPDC050406 TaxID=3364318 RepID=UPI003792AE53
MVEPHLAIAGYLRERREAARLTRAELARRASISEGLIQKIEQGTRQPTPAALAVLFDALEVPSVFRDYCAAILQPELSTLANAEPAPTRSELDFLHSLPHPACFNIAPAQDLLAANAAFLRAFPGLRPGGNIMVWMLLDPRARQVVEDWERETHVMVQAFRHMAPGFTPPERIAEITERCSPAAEWDRLWSTDIPPIDMAPRPIRIRPLEGGEWTAMYAHVLRYAYPRRGWGMFSLVPIAPL